jgi:hypothetical protein
MTTWDIVDKLDPSLQITVQKKNGFRLVGSVSSAVRTVLVLSVAVAASRGPQCIKQSGSAACGTAMHFKKANQSVSSSAPRGVARGTDTQHGQSSSKLARSLSTFFQPALSEDEYEDDYSFA